jgi:hypothetical protein
VCCCFRVVVPDKLEGLLCLEKLVSFGSIEAGESKSVALHFLAIQEGMLELKCFDVFCEIAKSERRSSSEEVKVPSKFRMSRPAFVYASVGEEDLF